MSKVSGDVFLTRKQLSGGQKKKIVLIWEVLFYACQQSMSNKVNWG